ncbi:homeobox protein CDX-1a isoform X2 [Lampris incognitus]|uniref:homeobox protein CDX-1a isoform X2 n=1 Tax=Lampris incognitus TaxID=2546036 RepID=UPI0024B6332B|nr:homeobox protein CDX-1a isoform X2 [Lampris incognitus]
MYPNSHPAQTLSSPYMTPAFGDFTGYHHVAGFGDHNGAWTPQYATQRDEWSVYGHSIAGSSPGAGHVAFSSPDLFGMPSASGGGSHPITSYNLTPGQDSSNSKGEKSYESIRHSGHPSVSGEKTRTKDKYRVVYTDHQRLELEREFQYSRYIASGRKAELSLEVGLSERQVRERSRYGFRTDVPKRGS